MTNWCWTEVEGNLKLMGMAFFKHTVRLIGAQHCEESVHLSVCVSMHVEKQLSRWESKAHKEKEERCERTKGREAEVVEA